MARWKEPEREAFAALRRAYLAEIPARIAAIRAAASTASQRGAPARAFQEVRDLTHRLVGSSAIFGLPRLSAAARELEDRAIASIDDPAGAGGLDELASTLESSWKEIAENGVEPRG